MQDGESCWRSASSMLLAASMSMYKLASMHASTLLDGCIGRRDISLWVRSNDLSLLIYMLTGELNGLEWMRESIEDALHRARYMAELVDKSTAALEDHGVEYVVFKTFNNAMRIDVDVDMLIPGDKYVEALRALVNKGFIPVDDIKKTYATGLMLPGNPIILDLHTKITVLGIQYINPDILLRNKTRSKWRLGETTMEAYTPTKTAEAAARIAHAIIKEAEIRIDDITETIPTIKSRGQELKTIMKRQNLNTAYNIFTQNTAKSMQEHLKNTPIRLPEKHRIKALIDKLWREKALTQLTKTIYNLRYKRNAAMTGKTLIKLVAKSKKNKNT